MNVERIVGRAAELALARALFAGLEDGPRAVLIEGERGIGKSTLWRAAIAEATVRVLASTARPGQLQFAGLAELLAGLEHEHLPAPQRDALDRLRASQALAVGVGLRNLLVALAPVVIAIDDADWLDDRTALALDFALRRVAGHPVGAILAGRAAEPSLEHVTRIALGPLPITALRDLLEARLGIVLPRPRLRRLAELSSGNPLVALELARAGWEPGAPPPDALRGLVDERIEAARRLAGRPDGAARQALLVAAALAQPTAELVEAGSSVAALSAAEDAGAIVLDADRVRVVRPLDAHAVYAATAPGPRRALHRRLAELAADPEERARQLAVATDPPDRRVAVTLASAASAAESRGDWEAAGDLFERAATFEPASAQLTVRAAGHHLRAGDAPHAGRLLEHVLAREPRHVEALRLLAAVRLQQEGVGPALALLEQAWASSDGPATTCAIELDAAALLLDHRGDTAAAARATERAEQTGDPTSREHARTLAALAAGSATWQPPGTSRAAWSSPTSPAADATRQPAAERAARTSPASPAARATPQPAARAAERGARTSPAPAGASRAAARTSPANPAARATPQPAARAAERGARTSPAGASPAAGRGTRPDAARSHRPAGEHGAWSPIVPSQPFVAARLALAAGRLADARDELLALRSDDASVLCRLAWIELLAGDPAAAEAHLREASLADGDLDRALVLALQAQVHAQRGDAGATRAAAGAAIERCTRLGSAHALAWATGAVALVELGRGDHAAAWAAAKRVGVRATTPLPLFAPALEALIALGRAKRAKQALDEAAARAHGPWDRAVLHRCLALQRASTRDVGGALDELDRALAAHDRLDIPFELARTLLVHGRLLRKARQRPRARDALEQALALLEPLGAHAWAEQARAELARAAGSPELTPAERRVAERAARGLANKEIARALDVTVHTVEVHLSRAYAKLGIRKRTQLAARLADGAP